MAVNKRNKTPGLGEKGKKAPVATPESDEEDKYTKKRTIEYVAENGCYRMLLIQRSFIRLLDT